MRQKISVMIVDEHRLFCECFTLALSKLEDSLIVEFALNPADAFDKANGSQPDIMLINLALSNNGAIELTKRVRSEFSQAKVIIFHVPKAESIILKCIESGAHGYVLIGATLQEFIKVIYLIYRGETVCSPKIAHSAFLRVAELARKNSDKQIEDSSNLTVREIEILQFVAQGLTNKEIARHLFLSSHTVKNHIHNIFEKLEVNKRSEMIFYAIGKGLIEEQGRQRLRSRRDESDF